MSLQVKIYQIQNFIHKDISGHIDSKRSIEIIRALCTAASFHSDHNILVDRRKTTKSVCSLYDLTNITMEFIQLMPSFKNKMAGLVPNDPEHISIEKKLVACMKIKKINYNFFTEYEDAIEWLSEHNNYRLV